MRKTFLMIAALVAFAACKSNDPEGNPSNPGETSSLQGNWKAYTGTMMDNNHPIDITFNGSNYIYHQGGYSPAKEEGTFTFQDNVITLTAAAYWTCGVDWSQGQQGGTPAEDGNWVSADIVYPTHKIKVLSSGEGYMAVENVVADFIPEGHKYFLANGNASPEKSQFSGTWEGTSENNGKTYRIVFDGGNYTLYELSDMYGKTSKEGEYTTFTVCSKYIGTWDYEAGGYLLLTPSKLWKSYTVVIDNYGTPQWYDCSPVNPITLEADPWREIEGADLWISTWSLVKLGDQVLVRIMYTNMDTFFVSKK